MTRILRVEAVYEGWGRYFVLTLRLKGGEEVRREIEDHGCAVAILPYDRERRLALLVRQLRAPVLYASGAGELLEAPAGRVESANPEDCARREALEEVGVRLESLEHLGKVWTMPGVSTEQIDLYLAAFEAKDRVGEGGGVASEHENISVIEMPLGELWQLCVSGKLNDLKTLALLQALRLRQPRLFLP